MADKEYKEFEGAESEYTVRTRSLDAWLDYLVQNGTFKNRDEAIDGIVDEYKTHFLTRRTSAPRIILSIVADGYRNHSGEDEVVNRVAETLYPIPGRRARDNSQKAVNRAIDNLGECANARIYGWDKVMDMWGLDSPDAPEQKQPLLNTIRNHLGSARNAVRGFLGATRNTVKTFSRVASSHISSLLDRLRGATVPVEVSAHTRHLANGKTVQVKAHTRKRPGEK